MQRRLRWHHNLHCAGHNRADAKEVPSPVNKHWCDLRKMPISAASVSQSAKWGDNTYLFSSSLIHTWKFSKYYLNMDVRAQSPHMWKTWWGEDRKSRGSPISLTDPHWGSWVKCPSPSNLIYTSGISTTEVRNPPLLCLHSCKSINSCIYFLAVINVLMDP